MRRTVLIIVLITAGIFAQQPVERTSDVVIRTRTQEVLLDFVARDKHNKLVKDLRAEEVEVYEDGVKQSLRSFHFREGSEALPGRGRGGIGSTAAEKAVYDP